MSEENEVDESGPDRRSIMKAAALIAVPVVGGGVVVAACSSGSGSSGSGGNNSMSVPTASVPVGGGYIDASNGVVVTQPEAGTYKAFSAICTHHQCPVNQVINNRISCPCHGSVFSAQDGSVLHGPAPSPLAAMTATVNGANVEVTGSAKS